MKKNKKILIVGGGLGGLATAICLSDKNFEISIIEKNSNLGGKINYFEGIGNQIWDNYNNIMDSIIGNI